MKLEKVGGVTEVGSVDADEKFTMTKCRFMQDGKPVAVSIGFDEILSIDYSGSVYVGGEKLRNVYVADPETE